MYDSEGLTWTKLSDDSCTIGITQLQAFMIGKVGSIVTKPPGLELSAGRSVAYLETPKYGGNLRAPLSGILEEVNGRIISNPSLINTDPYGKGWVARLRPTNLDPERDGLLDSGSDCESVKNLIEERGVRCFSVYPEYRISGIGGECPETLKVLGAILEAASDEDSALLVTDNPLAEQDIPRWASAHGYQILETRFEKPLKYMLLEKTAWLQSKGFPRPSDRSASKNLTGPSPEDWPMNERLPLLDHPLGSPSTFLPEALVNAVRADRHLEEVPIPEVCIQEFDGDLTDWLVSTGLAEQFNEWACFHTTMFKFDADGTTCGIVPRTIGGPYAVLVAEQMAVSGARLVLGLTSAGRVASSLPVPGLVVATRAIRDEGTSYHYLPAAAAIDGPREVAELLESELRTQPLPVLSGTVWTTDAPYRETERQLAGYAKAGVLAVEMQAASLFAFSKARRFPVGVVAHVTNSLDQTGKEFDKGSRQLEFEILRRICRAGKRYISSFQE